MIGALALLLWGTAQGLSSEPASASVAVSNVDQSKIWMEEETE